MFLPAALAHILLVVSFNFNPQKLPYLRLVLADVAEYRQRTAVDLFIVTNNVTALQLVLDNWGQSKVGSLWQHNHVIGNSDKYQLLWEHVKVVEREYKAKNHTTFLYIEDDTHIPWDTLVWWAIDTEVLAPLRFTRGLFRTELNPAGELVLLDPGERCNLTAWPRVLDLRGSPDGRRLLADSAKRYKRTKCASKKADEQPCQAHARYAQLNNPFMGMWVMTRPQLQRWMATSHWGYSGPYLRGWTLAEHSNGQNLMVDAQLGYTFNNLVPIIETADGPRISLTARVDHMRNGYSTMPGIGHGKVRWADYFFT